MFHVIAENFLSYKELDFDFSNRGLCLIEGVNKEEPSCKSNGAGKTSLIDSLCWGLYGKSFKVVAADKVVNIKEGGNCVVRVEWDGYHVIRYRKHSKFKNDLQFYQDGKDITAKSNKDTQELIDNVIGLSYESFVNSVYFQQNNLTTFATATDSEQKAIIENILGFKVLSEAQTVAKEKVKEFDTVIATLEQSINNAQLLENDRRVRIIAYNNQAIAFENLRIGEIEKAEATIKTLQEQKNSSVADFDVDEARQMVDIAAAVPAVVKELETTFNDLTCYSIISSQKRKLAQQTLESHIKNYHTKEAKIKAYKDKAVPTCITCGQTIKAQAYIDALYEMQKELLEIETQAVECEAELANIEPPVDLANQLAGVTEELEAKRGIIELAERLKRKIMAEEYRLKEVALIDERVAHHQKIMSEQQAKPNPYLEQQIVAEKELKIILTDIDVLDGKIKEKQTERSYYQYWVDGLANSSLKSYIMDSITPMLNERANYYAGFLTGGSIQIEISTQTKLKTGEMRDKFSVNIHSLTGADYELCSGGEKKRIDICILLALQDLVRTRAKQPLNLVIFDEVAENLDEVGIERLVDMLHNIGSERGTCLYVTHSEDMKPMFPNIITVIKQNGKSYIFNDE